MKKLINRILSLFGYKIIKSRFDAGGDIDFSSCKYADLVIDIGVAGGTPWLYSAFPKASYILIDPLPISKSGIEKYLSKSQYEIIVSGLSDEKNMIEINVDLESSSLSSFCERTALSDRGHLCERRLVSVNKLDTLLSSRNISNHIVGIKIDVEGYELKALRGAKETLKKAQFIIAEVSTSRRFENSYNFSELISFLYNNDFVLDHVIRFSRDSNENIRTADMMFVKNEK